MARPQKEGLDYFPLDVGFFSDRKVKIIKARYGADGLAVYLYILCEIYKDKGYYLKTDDDFIYTISDDLNMSYEKIGQILNFLLERSLFDDTLFKSDKVLSSRGIQARFQEAIKRRAVKKLIEVKDKYWLLDDRETESYIKVANNASFSEKNPSYSAKNPSYSDEKTHKVKESKEKKSKVEESMEYAPDEEESPSAPPIITLPLNDKSEYPVTGAQVLEWSELYPAIDIEQQLRNMRGWLLSNPEKRKTKRGICSFITRWLSKEQDRGGTRIRGETRAEPAGTYDYEALEKQAFRRVSG